MQDISDEPYNNDTYLFERFQETASVRVLLRTSAITREQYIRPLISVLGMFTFSPIEVVTEDEGDQAAATSNDMLCCLEGLDDTAGVQWVLFCVDGSDGSFYTIEPRWSDREIKEDMLVEQLFQAMSDLLDQRLQRPPNLL